MTGMSMPQQTWYGAAAGYLGMWMAMMVPMMLPSLVPMVSRYRRSVRGADGLHLHGLTALVGVGYFVIWAVLGVAAYAAGAGVMAVEMRWGDGGAMAAGRGRRGAARRGRRAAHLVEGAAAGALPRRVGCDGRPPAPNALGAWRHGLRLGVRCSLCCGSLMLALLAIGMMDLVAMVAVTLAISAERLAPAPLRVARAAGVAIVVVGVLTIARI